MECFGQNARSGHKRAFIRTILLESLPHWQLLRSSHADLFGKLERFSLVSTRKRFDRAGTRARLTHAGSCRFEARIDLSGCSKGQIGPPPTPRKKRETVNSDFRLGWMFACKRRDKRLRRCPNPKPWATAATARSYATLPGSFANLMPRRLFMRTGRCRAFEARG